MAPLAHQLLQLIQRAPVTGPQNPLPNSCGNEEPSVTFRRRTNHELDSRPTGGSARNSFEPCTARRLPCWLFRSGRRLFGDRGRCGGPCVAASVIERQPFTGRSGPLLTGALRHTPTPGTAAVSMWAAAAFGERWLDAAAAPPQTTSTSRAGEMSELPSSHQRVPSSASTWHRAGWESVDRQRRRALSRRHNRLTRGATQRPITGQLDRRTRLSRRCHAPPTRTADGRHDSRRQTADGTAEIRQQAADGRRETSDVRRHRPDGTRQAADNTDPTPDVPCQRRPDRDDSRAV